MDIKQAEPAEPTFTLNLTATELSIITAALGHTNGTALKPEAPRPYRDMRHALVEAGYPDPFKPARDAGLRVRDVDGEWAAV